METKINKRREGIYRVLEVPTIYRLAQTIFAGGKNRLLDYVAEAITQLPPADFILDLGCGPTSYLSKLDKTPIGLDISPSYIADFMAKGGVGTVASADRLPFRDNVFEGVWSIGVFHHLPDHIVARAMSEALRVCQPGGYVAILDAVLPHRSMQRPIAALTRRMDRGKFMRKQTALEALLLDRPRWRVERHTYSATGFEMIICSTIKPEA